MNEAWQFLKVLYEKIHNRSIFFFLVIWTWQKCRSVFITCIMELFFCQMWAFTKAFKFLSLLSLYILQGIALFNILPTRGIYGNVLIGTTWHVHTIFMKSGTLDCFSIVFIRTKLVYKMKGLCHRLNNARYNSIMRHKDSFFSLKVALFE